MDTISAVYSTLPLIKEQLREQARAERLEELRQARDAAWVAKAREALDAYSRPGAEFHKGRADILKISDARVSSGLALANHNIDRCARYLAQEVIEGNAMALFDDAFRKHFDKTCRDIPIPYPKRNQLNSLIHTDFRSEAQALEVWDLVAAVIRRIYAVHHVIMPFNQTYRLLRAATFNVDTAVNYHLMDVRAYRELKPALMAECHAERPDEYDPECAHTMLRRTNHSVSEALLLYSGEMRRRWRAVAELKEELRLAHVTPVASDRALYQHLVLCFWDMGLAKDRYDYAVLCRAETEREAAIEADRVTKQQQQAAQARADAATEAHVDGKRQQSKRKGAADADSDAPLVVEVLQGPQPAADTDKVPAASEAEDDDIGIERDIDFAGEGDGQSSSERMMAAEAARRALLRARLEDGERRDEPVLPNGAPFEPQTEINKLTAVMNVDPALFEVDAVWVPLPANRRFTDLADRLVAAGGGRLLQEFNSVKTWRLNQPVVTRGHHLPCKHVVWTPVGAGEAALSASVDAALAEMKNREWRSMVLSDGAPAQPEQPVHRLRHVMVCRTRVFLDVISNRRKTDAIVFASANLAVHQCWLRTMLAYFPGPSAKVGERFAAYKEGARGVLKDPAFLQELQDMRLPDEEDQHDQHNQVCYIAETPRTKRACCGKL